MISSVDARLDSILELRNKDLIVIDNLWTNDILNQLYLELSLKKEEMKSATIGANRLSNKSVRKDKILWWEPSLLTEVQTQVNSKISQIKNFINTNLFLGIKDHELHYALYEPGDFYSRHIDQIHHKTDRIVTFILYLNPNWAPEDGGKLLVYNDFNSNDPIHKIEPIWGRTVLFLSDTSPHEVEKTNAPRSSLTGWLRG